MANNEHFYRTEAPLSPAEVALEIARLDLEFGSEFVGPEEEDRWWWGWGLVGV